MPHRSFKDATQYATHYFSYDPLLFTKQKPNCSAFACLQEDAALFRGLKTCERCPRRRLPLPRTEEMAASVQEATVPEDELVEEYPKKPPNEPRGGFTRGRSRWERRRPFHT